MSVFVGRRDEEKERAYFIAMIERLGMSRFAAAVMNICVAATSTKSRNVLRTALIIEL